MSFVLLLSQGVNVRGVHIEHDTPGGVDVFPFKSRSDVLEGFSIGQVNEFIDIDLECPAFIGEHVMHE